MLKASLWFPFFMVFLHKFMADGHFKKQEKQRYSILY